MRSRLSIFSFSTLRDPRPSRTLALAAAILLIGRVLLALAQPTLERLPPQNAVNPQLLDVLDFLERERPEPEVVFFGSSRFQSAVHAREFESRSGRPEGYALNLAVRAGDPWIARRLLRQRPEAFRSTRLAVVELEPWMFNANFRHPLLKKPQRFRPYYYRWATLPERWAVPDWRTRGGLLAQWLAPSYERRTIMDWGRAIKAVVRPESREPQLPRFAGHHDARVAAAQSASPDFRAENIREMHLYDFEIAPDKVKALRQLVSDLQARSIQVLLVQPPVREAYLEPLRGSKPGALAYRQLLGEFRALEGEGVRFILWETAADCDLDESIFIDYGHFTAEGARRFTARLWEAACELGPW